MQPPEILASLELISKVPNALLDERSGDKAIQAPRH